MQGRCTHSLRVWFLLTLTIYIFVNKVINQIELRYITYLCLVCQWSITKQSIEKHKVGRPAKARNARPIKARQGPQCTAHQGSPRPMHGQSRPVRHCRCKSYALWLACLKSSRVLQICHCCQIWLNCMRYCIDCVYAFDCVCTIVVCSVYVYTQCT